MSLIASIPLRPKVVASPETYFYPDLKIMDRIGGKTSGLPQAVQWRWSYLFVAIEGNPEQISGNLNSQNKIACQALVAANTLEAFSGVDGTSSQATTYGAPLDAANVIVCGSLGSGSDLYTLAPTTVDASVLGTVLYIGVASGVVEAIGTYEPIYGRNISSTSQVIAYSVAKLTGVAEGYTATVYGSIGSPTLYTNPIIQVWTTIGVGWETSYVSPVPGEADVSTVFMWPYDNTLFIDNKLVAGVGTSEWRTASEVESANIYEIVPDPQAANTQYLSHCAGAYDDRQIVDVVNNIVAKFEGNAYLDSTYPTYDGTNLRIVPNLNPTQVSTVNCTNFFVDQLEHDFTISFWIKLANLPAQYCPLFCSKGQTGNVDFIIGLNGETGLLLWASNSAGAWNVFNASDLGLDVAINSWCQITLVRAGNSLCPFVNGQLGSVQSIVGNLTGGSEPSGFNSLSVNPTAKFDNFFVSRTALHTSAFVPHSWTVDSYTEAMFLFDEVEGSTSFVNSAIGSSMTASATGSAKSSEETPYSGRSCAKLVYGPSKVTIADGLLDGLFVAEYTVELFFYMTSHSGTYCPLLVNTDGQGHTDLILGFTVDNVLRIWASSTGSTSFDVFNAQSTGVTITPNTWNYLHFSGGNGSHRAVLNGASGTELSAAQISGGKPTFDAFTSDTSVHIGEIRLSKCIQPVDMRVFVRRLLNRQIEQFGVTFYDPNVTMYPPVTISAEGENVDQTIVYP